jgi:integrase/recombinase XerD
MNQKYKFSAALLSELEGFECYLKEQHQHSSSSVRQHKTYAGLFHQWLEKESMNLGQITHAELLDYADKLKEAGHSISYINRHFLALRYYFNHLQKENKAAYNPAAGIRLKGSVRLAVSHELLSKEELSSLYESYPVKDARSQRNKIILSLLIFQGITNENLHHLEASHIKLKEGKIHIPAGNQTNSRILKLEAEQIMELYEYIHVTRPKILAEQASTERSGRKPKQFKEAETIHQLFVSMNGCENFKTSLYHFNRALRKINPKLKNAAQIRQSVITEWLKEKDLRTVQYMAGHRHVSSTERYQTNNLEDLKEALNKYHPLK